MDNKTLEKIAEKLKAASEEKTVRIFNDIIDILHGDESGGGGGSAEPLMVTIEENEQGYVLSASYDDIKEALTAGKNVFIYGEDAEHEEEFTYTLVAIQNGYNLYRATILDILGCGATFEARSSNEPLISKK